MPNAAGDLYVDAGVAASDVICCVRLGVHSTTGNHSAAVALLKRADSGSERYLNILLNLTNKAAYTHQNLAAAELTKMSRAAEHLLEAAKKPWPPAGSSLLVSGVGARVRTRMATRRAGTWAGTRGIPAR